MSPSAPRPAAGGGRWVEVSPERLARWLAGFADRHGDPRVEVADEGLTLHAPDGAVAVCEAPFPPFTGTTTGALVAHAGAARRVGVLLVRLGGYAVGVFAGETLEVSKVGARPVHGRSAAGGQSQQRFARRREGQARVALQAAADTAARVLLPHAAGLDAVVAGGDGRAVAEVLADRRLEPLRERLTGRLLDVPDPRHAVLAATPAAFRAVRIRLTDPPG